jgi:hypothetical protein
MIKTAMYRNVDKEKNVVLGAKKDVVLGSYALQNKYGVTFMDTRGAGILKGKAFKLNTEKFNWVLAKDDQGALCLIPRKKV